MVKVATGSSIRGNNTPGGNYLDVSEEILFKQGEDTTESPPFQVAPGSAVKISVFIAGGHDTAASGDKWRIQLLSVIRPSKERPRAKYDDCGCGPTFEPVPSLMSDLYSEPMYVDGKPVVMTETNNTMVVSIPGDYRLRIVTGDTYTVPVDNIVAFAIGYKGAEVPRPAYAGGGYERL